MRRKNLVTASVLARRFWGKNERSNTKAIIGEVQTMTIYVRNKLVKLVPVLCALIALLVVSVSVFADQKQVTVTWLGSSHAEKAVRAIRDVIIEEYEAANPHVKIERLEVPRSDYFSQFAIMAQGGQTPDIYSSISSFDVAKAANEGWLADIGGFLAQDPEFMNAFFPEGLKGGVYRGKQYAMPYWSGVYGILYNKEKLLDAGLDPENLPTTWEQYLDWMKKLTKDTNDDGVIDQWGAADVFGRTDTNARHMYAWIWSNGGDLFNEDLTKSLLDSPEAIEAIRFRTDLFLKHKVIPPGPTTYEYVEETNAFAHGVVASITNAQWAVAKVLTDNPSMEGKLVVGPFPHNGTPATTLWPLYITIPAGAKHKDEAWDFLKFLLSKENLVRQALASAWIVPRRDVENDEAIKQDPYLSAFSKLMADAKVLQVANPQMTEMAYHVIDMIHKVLLSQSEVEPAAREAAKQINSLLE